ncbi:hypothetical protein [Janthinobacterium sp. 1_2014MBL_MicDiv]|uniref:hypothetical protein n=1 Tax=Janthinobacterium sp. 1_2014MBL_MicDiv TaxID=1644131 RepID=UPI0012EB5A0F|nr:hypothetical protein [Janthinobacterium sp. 1_2014MBL_MicDiv]
MSIPQVTVPRDKKTLEFFINRALLINLAHVYQQLVPGKTVDDFYRSVLLPLVAERVFGDELLKKAYEQEGIHDYEIFMISCGYLAEAKIALIKGDRRRAWSCAMDSMSFCSSAKNAASYVRDLDGTINAQVDQILSQNASNSAKHRTEPYKDVGAEAVRIIKQRCEAGERWDSINAAAREICSAMGELAISKGVPFYAQDGGLKTLSKYLADAPDLVPYFTKKRGRPKKNSA